MFQVYFFFLKEVCPLFTTSITSSKDSIAHLPCWCEVIVMFTLLALLVCCKCRGNSCESHVTLGRNLLKCVKTKST